MDLSLLLGALIGIAVGLIVGALGAGGGIISVPVLVYLLHQNPHAATAESLIIVIMAALAGLVGHHRRGHIRWRDGLLFGVISTFGGIAGGRLSAFVRDDYLLIAFSLLLFVVAFIMLRKAISLKKPTATTVGAATTPKNPAWWAIALAAIATGGLTGFFGVGGGFAVVPVLILVLGFDALSAAGTSLVVMIIAALSGLLARVGTSADINWWLTILFGLGSMIGSAAGAPLASKAKPWVLTSLFAALLTLVAIFTLTNTLIKMF